MQFQTRVRQDGSKYYFVVFPKKAFIQAQIALRGKLNVTVEGDSLIIRGVEDSEKENYTRVPRKTPKQPKTSTRDRSKYIRPKKSQG